MHIRERLKACQAAGTAVLATNFYNFETLTAVINSDMDFYSRLMKIDANSRLVTKIVSSLKVRVRQALVAQSPLDKKKIDLSAGYITSGMLAAYQDWFNSGREQSIEAFSKEVSVLVFSGVSGLFGKDAGK